MLLQWTLKIFIIFILSCCSYFNHGQITLPPGAPIVSCGEYNFFDPGSDVPITSPNFPLDYPNNTHCVWVFICSKEGAPISITISNFSLPTSPDCKNDSLLIRNGLRSNSTVIAHLCGTNVRRTFVSSQNNVRMEFNSDSTITSTGFSMNAHCISNETIPSTAPAPTTSVGALPPGSVIISCGEYDFIEPGGSINITSPNYPANYDNNQRCRYAIVCSNTNASLTVRFFAFDVQSSHNCTKDVVILRDGLKSDSHVMAHICGNSLTRAIYKSTQGNLRVEFDADSSITKKGFVAQISCPSPTQPTTTTTPAATTTTPAATASTPAATTTTTAATTTTPAATSGPTTSKPNISTTPMPWKALKVCRGTNTTPVSKIISLLILFVSIQLITF